MLRAAVFCTAFGLVLMGCAGEPERVTVPNVTTVGLDEAFHELRALGLRVAIPERFELDTLHSPGPMSQSPEAGTEVERGTTVKLLDIFSGPTASGVCPRMPRAEPLPNVVGMNAHAAVHALGPLHVDFGMVPALPSSQAPDLLSAYRVRRQRPAAGTRLPPCEPVVRDGRVWTRVNWVTLSLRVGS